MARILMLSPLQNMAECASVTPRRRAVASRDSCTVAISSTPCLLAVQIRCCSSSPGMPTVVIEVLRSIHTGARESG